MGGVENQQNKHLPAQCRGKGEGKWRLISPKWDMINSHIIRMDQGGGAWVGGGGEES